MESRAAKFITECCVRCNNKELIRAIKTNNRALFDTILKSKGKISSFQEKQGSKMLENTVSLSLDADNSYFFEKLMTLIYDPKALEKSKISLTSAEPSR